MKDFISETLELVKDFLRFLRKTVRMIIYYGKKRFCPVCGKSCRCFLKGGLIPRKDAICIHCGSLERHRFLWLFISKRTDLFDGKPKNMLHVAPETCFQQKFKQRLRDNYLTADLFNPRAMIRMDITNINFPDEYFNVIYCSHVLEHVQEDIKAMKEFYRTLKNDGWAILLVPIYAKKTIEDPTITDPRERLRVFGQEDHVRVYGPDYVNRLKEAGFIVEIITVGQVVQHDEAVKMGLTSASGEIYFCKKR